MNYHKQEQFSGIGDSNFYLEKLKRGLEQVHAGLGIIKTIEELEAMEKDESYRHEAERDRLIGNG